MQHARETRTGMRNHTLPTPEANSQAIESLHREAIKLPCVAGKGLRKEGEAAAGNHGRRKTVVNGYEEG